MRVALDRKRVVRAIAAALDRGATEPLRKRPDGKVHHWFTRYAGNCSNPVLVEQTGRPLTKGGKSVHAVDMTGADVMLHEIEVPCRLCANCLRRRAAHWRLRALAETKAAPRTWFGTLTLSPEQHSRVAMALRSQYAQNGDDWDASDDATKFATRHALISREITLYLKRVRKDTNGNGIRFCCVAEEHKTGLPHYHMLVHEGLAAIVKWANLSENWRIGFSNWKLVTDAASAGYVTKYLAKSSKARVRASLDYGNPPRPCGIAPELERETSDLTNASGNPASGVSGLTSKEDAQ